MKLHELHAIPGANKAGPARAAALAPAMARLPVFGSKGQKARSGVKHAGFRGRPDASGTPPAEGWL